ncbi:protein mono-ADP-ribosyltransferase PARP12-like [Mercenaria mercenaria]|uniref:protein mono-ADP-ribosyltransferase PARP12-like n=1 Tax=Mercenaria mercenaria TaxID=6596 RepID=UPI00234F4E15|nr:protein mono-ADP-ribosyltransferase PARP12-like [Mercenaria mercenaria]XP_053379365.1 protein mono-ADP-ribosyltransferase PARP12-like [Mercenaria mercenaria]XP_053379366.1 protein mono-ADP-ribosyltransferase PARP12-like [Mercenaria mercenaria]XP_053379367.1 protein mono-ADP-ribosyltransferase PARP12-like [Mercenaria mercenaria]XP_053379368.1 protein mono-ADP-ribosyltransferase PARP12-like [Mercenaria mercenaria]
MSGARRIPQQLPIYDADTMAPMFKSPNTNKQPPRIPIKATRPYSEFSTPPPVLSSDIQPNVGSCCVSINDNDCSKSSRRSRHSSIQRNRTRSGNRWNSVERGEHTSARGRQQFTDHQIANPKIGTENFSTETSNLDSGPLSAFRGKSPHYTEITSPDDVFNFMVKYMEGSGTPEDIKTQSRLFPTYVDISDWFRKNKSRFTLIEKNGSVSHVLVYSKQVSCCLDYYRKVSCSKSDCHRYHICKNLLSGKCVFGRKNCNFSHDCFDENNLKISNALGYNNLYTNEEICSILKVSFPHVCTEWALKGFCGKPNCFELHICPRYILGKCNKGPNCSHIHDRKSDHNKPILDAFEMSEMQYNVFKWRVFMINNPAWKRNEQIAADGASPLLPGNKPRFGNKNLIKEESDAAGDTFICTRHLLEECHDRSCKYVHSNSRLPYIWQIKLFGTWISLNESEDVEKAFADNAYRSDRIRMTYDGMELVTLLLFEPTIKARVIVYTDESPTETEARRLSTMSYNRVYDISSSFENEREENTDGFYTQWRWYWKDDLNQWFLFEPDAFQHTLEAKYLAKQKTFTFSRENYFFNYTISFDPMYQTNNDTRKSRAIRRRPLLVTPEDVKRKRFPNVLSDIHLIETPLPKSWVPWDLIHPFELVDITDSNTLELQEVTKLFFNTVDCRKEKIDTISRLQNHKLWGLFCSQERTMEANAMRVRGPSIPVDKRYLFHGTDGIDAVRGICVNNFDVRVSGKSGILYGDGAYFARDAKYSHAYTKGPERYMFVVNVLVGQYTKGSKSYRRPPHKPGSDHELFDSCVDNDTNPSIFVVFDKNQYYPEYLITYHDEEQENVARKANDRTQITKINQQSTPCVASSSSRAVRKQSSDKIDSLSKQQMIQDYSSHVYNSPSLKKPHVSSSDDTDTGSSVSDASVRQLAHGIKYIDSAGRGWTPQDIKTSTKDSRQSDVVSRQSDHFDKGHGNIFVDVDDTDGKMQQVIYPPVRVLREMFDDKKDRINKPKQYEPKQHPLNDPSRVGYNDPVQYYGSATTVSDSSGKKRYPKTPPRSRRIINQYKD